MLLFLIFGGLSCNSLHGAKVTAIFPGVLILEPSHSILRYILELILLRFNQVIGFYPLSVNNLEQCKSTTELSLSQ